MSQLFWAYLKPPSLPKTVNFGWYRVPLLTRRKCLIGRCRSRRGRAGKIFHGRQGEAFEGDVFFLNLSFLLLDWILKGPFFDRDVFFWYNQEKNKKQWFENELFWGDLTNQTCNESSLDNFFLNVKRLVLFGVFFNTSHFRGRSFYFLLPFWPPICIKRIVSFGYGFRQCLSDVEDFRDCYIYIFTNLHIYVLER